MAAPTSAVQKLQKILANVGPSTHGLNARFRTVAPRILRNSERFWPALDWFNDGAGAGRCCGDENRLDRGASGPLSRFKLREGL